MKKSRSADDVISISSSSDDDSDCRIVKVVPSPAKRDKNKMRWQYQPRSMPRARASRRDKEEMPIRQQDEAVYEDRRDMASTPKGHARRFKPESTATCSDATLNARFQSASQSIEPLRCGSKVDRLSDTGSNNAKINSRAMMRDDLADPLPLQQRTTDLEEMGTSPPLLLRRVESKRADEDDEGDGRREVRARSCSTATLDLSTVAQLRGSWDFEDVREITDVLAEPSESLPNVLMELADSTKSIPPSADSVVPHISDHDIPLQERTEDFQNDSDVTNSNICTQNSKVSLDEAPSRRPIKSQLPSPIPQQQRSPSPQLLNEASARAHRRLPRAGKWRALNSVINFAAFEALPGPLITRPKEMLHPVTYGGMVKERAEKEARKRKRRDDGMMLSS
ncbi:hypothetical protein TARUN_1639 [Trichoderma arundinaceum]|uniref:Uncharacterized protein n=1 Tax=Trichoderma arundinaceum TaxID=490622 RepID=A0A395NWQ2_TRIAR|nr:hypothetical protein TARUN_1639 [Trichoderma arundinaceum]